METLRNDDSIKVSHESATESRALTSPDDDGPPSESTPGAVQWKAESEAEEEEKEVGNEKHLPGRTTSIKLSSAVSDDDIKYLDNKPQKPGGTLPNDYLETLFQGSTGNSTTVHNHKVRNSSKKKQKRSSKAEDSRRKFITLPIDELEALIDSKVNDRMNREKQEIKAAVLNREKALMEAVLKREKALVKHEREEMEFQMEASLRQEQEERKALEARMESLRMDLSLHTTPPDIEKSINNRNIRSEDNIELLELVDGKYTADQNAEEVLRYPIHYKNSDEWHDGPYGESVFSLLYICSVKSQGFWYSVFVYCLQIATISLTLLDALDAQSEDNPLQIPPMVTIEVTCAQGVTIFMLFMWQSDLIEAIKKLEDGFYPELLELYPSATFSTWLVSCLAQLVAGLLVLLGCFVLTLKASTVVDLMLNLTALLFISEIDDAGFHMAKMGFINNALQRETIAVVDLQVPKRKRHKFYQRSLYFLILVCLFTGYGIIKERQLNGYYLPTNIYAQFGDAYNQKIPFYSGFLTATKTRTAGYRAYRDLGTSSILLAYCAGKRAWTFSEDTEDPCHGYFGISSETTNYDVTSVPDSDWQVLDSNGRLQPFNSFSLVDGDCRQSTCQGSCGSNGLCQCSHDQFGLDCEFHDVCEEIVIDSRFSSLPQVLTPSLKDPETLELSAFSKKFQLLRSDISGEYVRINYMPVYYSNDTFPANIMIFGGRRWVLTTEQELINLAEAREEYLNTWHFPQKTVAVLADGFHADYKASYTPFFISDPVDFETPDFKATPIGLEWWTVKNSNKTLRHFIPDAPTNTIFLCQETPPSCLNQPGSFCGLHGTCNNETGYCDCNDDFGFGYYYGDRCELVKPCYEHFKPCNGHGNCNEESGLCSCHLPWHGDACLSIHDCFEEEGRCQNGGVCNMVTGKCDCPADPAITGEACEETADCYAFGCANGGVCGFTGKCVCRPPFHGAHCDLVDENVSFCFRDEDCINGTCNQDTGFCDCADPASYGPLCENRYNCSHRMSPWGPSCLNNGSCDEKSGVCSCQRPYFGPDCSQVPPCLSDEDCSGRGKCDVENGMCQCYYDTINMGKRAGRLCEYASNVYLCWGNDMCYGHGSTCANQHCNCEHGFGGHQCFSLIADEYLPFRDTFQKLVEENVELCGFEDPICCFNNTGYSDIKEVMCPDLWDKYT